MAALTYPSGRVITYTPNSSGGYTAGRSVSAVDSANSINYVTLAKYAPQGALASLSHGTSISEALTYNSRLQPLQLYYTTGTISSGTLTQLQQSGCPTTVAVIMSRSYISTWAPGTTATCSRSTIAVTQTGLRILPPTR